MIGSFILGIDLSYDLSQLCFIKSKTRTIQYSIVNEIIAFSRFKTFEKLRIKLIHYGN